MKPIRPIHICAFIAACMALIAVLCLILPKEINWDVNLRTPQLTTIFGIDSTDTYLADGDEPMDSIEVAIMTDSSIVEKDLSATVLDTNFFPPIAEETRQDFVLDEIEDTTDMRIYLSAFYQSLHNAGNTAIRVVHYGDSQIEEDRISMQIRRTLQNHYGGGGVGLIPLHQTIATRTLWQTLTMNDQVQRTNGGPKRYMVYGPSSFHRKGGVYGPMGQVAIMDNEVTDGSEDISLQVRTISKPAHSETYFNRVHIWKSGAITASVDKATETNGDIFVLPDSTTNTTIHLQGDGEVYGISLETEYGIMVDNIPMRGCAGTIFTGIASNELKNYFLSTNTRLIILQYGGNIMPGTRSRQQVVRYIEKTRTQVQYLQYLAPNSSILFIGPSDMCERKDGVMHTYAMLPVMDRALRQMAKEENISYFSMYHAMGGSDSMVRWKEQGLAGGDYIHFTPKGAEKAGQMIADWLMNK